jgi:23S rRNA (uracil1939-C5)-methyltransferase
LENTLIKIDRLALKGDGVGVIANHDGPAAQDGSAAQDRPAETTRGKVAFVPYSLPDEKIFCQKMEEKVNYSRWLPQKLEVASSFRQIPPCPIHFIPGKEGPWCGGCDWQHIQVEHQRKWKKELVRETLIRLGRIPNPAVDNILFSAEALRYRNKVQIPFAPAAGGFAAGFYAPGSHDIVEFDDCVVQPELSIKIFAAVRYMAEERRWEPYDKDGDRGWLRHLLIRTNSAGQALVALVTKESRFDDRDICVEKLRSTCPSVIGIFQNIQPQQTNVILGEQWIQLWGDARLKEKIGGLDISFSPGAFMQVNTSAAELLYNKAMELAFAGPEWTALDLYCGVGVMALMAAKRMRKAIGVEDVPMAIADAALNARQNKVFNVSFIRASVEEYCRKNFSRSSSQGVNPERLVVIVDPPRAGLKPEVINHLLRLEPSRMVYVSCDPATLARDVKQLSRKYAVGRICPVDLFPQTSHIETIVLLNRK